MRPIELTIDRFTCFREKTQINFERLDVFGISGATGAGKSSILDAITFALFGRVARVGNRCSSLISLGRDRMSVALKFGVGQRVFTVARTLRPKSSTAQLDEGDFKIAEGVREVDARIESLLGMPFDTFTQAVLLPQGQFAKFLGASGAERTRILRDLLNLDVYDQMRKAAVVAEKTASERVKIFADQRAKHFGHATRERVDELTGSTAAQRAKLESLQVAIAAARASNADLRARREKTEALEAALAKRSARDEREEASLAQKLSIAVAAESLRAPIDGLAAITRRVEQRQGDALVRANAVEQASRAHDENVTAHQRAVGAMGELEPIEARIVALDRLTGVCESLERERAALEAARANAEKLDRAIVAALAARDRLRPDETAARDALARAERAAEGASYDRAIYALVEGLEPRARAIVQARSALTALSERVTRETVSREKGAALLDKAEQGAASAKTDRDKRAAALAKARASLEAKRHARHVVELRAGLTVGEPCPVCEKPIDTKPPKPRAPRGKDAEDVEAARVEEAEAALAEARQNEAKLKAEVDHRRERLAELTAASDEASAAHASQIAAVEALEGVLRASVAEHGLPASADLAAGLIGVYEAQRSARRAFESAEEQRTRAVEAVRKLERASVTAGAVIEKLEHERALARGETTRLDGLVAEYKARIGAVTSEADPRRERELLASRVLAVKERARGAEARAQKTGASLDAARSAREAAETELRREIGLSEEQRAELTILVLEAGFRTIEEATAALQPREELARLKASVALGERERRVLDAEIEHLSGGMNGPAVSREELDASSAARAELEAEHERVAIALGREEQELASTLADVIKAEEIDRDLARETKRRDLHGELAADLGAAQFQQYLQGAVVHDLVNDASARLRRLSRERYALVVHDDDFWVVDHDNASARRPASTLSGGETFLASLALALALSDQVQKAVGAVRLESLFIDEGFGTLDPEALDVAAEAIESLDEGGRMVGIISHLPELNQRMHRELVVEKGLNGSTVRVKQA